MNKVNIYNASKVQKTIKGTDGKVYYLPPRTVKHLPSGIQVAEGIDRNLIVTIPE